MGATNPHDADPGTIRRNLEFQLIKILYMVLTERKCGKRNKFFFKD